MAPTAVAENQDSFIEYFLLGYLIAQIGYGLSPLDELNADIAKLKGDALFMERWMLLNDDPESLEKAEAHLSRIQKELQAKEKKRKRTVLWFIPAITVINTGAILLFEWLRKD